MENPHALVFKHLIVKNVAETLGTVSMGAGNSSFLSEHEGSLHTGLQWTQMGKEDSVFSSVLPHSQGCFQSWQTAWRGEGKAVRWFLVGEGKEDSLSAAWMFTNIWKSKIAMETFISAYT